MDEELPDGTYQGYSTFCPVCRKTVKCNMQGDIDDPHECIPYEPPVQIGCIIPIWGNAVNKNLKEFIKWFNENYKVLKKSQSLQLIVRFDNHAEVKFTLDEILMGGVFIFCSKNNCTVKSYDYA